MSKYTPGPWKKVVGLEAVSAYDEQMLICDLRGWGYLTGPGGLDLPTEEALKIQDANARLIAKAPDLLETVIDLVARVDPDVHQEAIDRAKNIIKQTLEAK